MTNYASFVRDDMLRGERNGSLCLRFVRNDSRNGRAACIDKTHCLPFYWALHLPAKHSFLKLRQFKTSLNKI